MLRFIEKYQAVCCLVFAFALVLASVGTAWGRTAHRGETQFDRWGTVDYGSPVDSVDLEKLAGGVSTQDYSFVDESSGASLSHYLNSSSDSSSTDAFTPPAIESLDVRRGEECLHAEGTCKACDELRAMYRNGEVDALYCVTIAPDVDVTDSFSLSVPLDTWVSKYASFRCDNGALETSYSPIRSNSETGFFSMTFRGTMDELQHPFGITYNKSRPQESSALSVHAYTPDDDDKEVDWLETLLGIVEAIVIFAAIGGVVYLLGRFWDESQIKWE